jgi:hypothetical protein
MKDRIYLLVRCTVDTNYPNIHDAIAEFQEQTHIQVTSTTNVHIQTAEIIKLNTRTIKR